MSGSRRELKEKIKMEKMRKIELQQAIIKKKQCDAKALAIVEQLLEPNVDSDWLIQNLKFINKSHLEDVIEERVIIKLCGYVLCSKPLTVVVKQQYCISTRTNKVYDITKRKKFCSSWCYRASNYLLEQILQSPLWLREKEIIPVFKLLPINSVESFHGDAVVGVNSSQNTDIDDIGANKELIKVYGTKQSHKSSTTSSIEVKNSSYSSSNTSVEEPTQVKDTLINIETQSLCGTHSSELCTNQQDEKYSFQICTNHGNGNNDHTEKEHISSKNLGTHTAVQFNNIQHIHEHVDEEIEKENANVRLICSNNDIEILQAQLDETSNNTNDSSKISHSQSHKINNSPEDSKIVQTQLYRTYNNKDVTSPKYDNIKSKSEKIKNKQRQEESNYAKVQASVHRNLVMHVEQSFREWVTKNTLCLLLDEEDEKFQLLENFTQQDRYEQLCKKLNRLQLQDKKEDNVDLEKNILKPLPHLSVLKEEGKKLELKVRAFYKGQVTISEDSNNESKNENDGEPILPLTSARTPNALRQRIFLDKLNKILPDLLYALTRVPVNASTSATQSICYNNTHSLIKLIKLLVSTFHLSATNIVFKTAEWTLVGLIIIKMLSLIDMQLQSVLESKQASMYTSMILTSYKLDLSYLDRLMSDVINNKDTCK